MFWVCMDDHIHTRVRNLNAFYNNAQMLFDINIDIHRRSINAIIGSSGCGKSTLLRCFNRMNEFNGDFHYSGLIEVHGCDICDVKPELLRAKVGMVFQRPNPFPKSIYDNISYGPRIHGIHNRKGKLDSIVESSLRKVGLWNEVCDKLNESALGLSGGQQQKLCIARAISVKPTMLLLDEPTSALDPFSRDYIEELILTLKNKMTIVFVTHYPEQSRKLANYITFMDKGMIVKCDTANSIINNDEHEIIQNYFQKK